MLTTYEHNLIDVEKHLAEAEAEVRVYKEVVDIVKHIPAEKESRWLQIKYFYISPNNNFLMKRLFSSDALHVAFLLWLLSICC